MAFHLRIHNVKYKYLEVVYVEREDLIAMD